MINPPLNPEKSASISRYGNMRSRVNRGGAVVLFGIMSFLTSACADPGPATYALDSEDTCAVLEAPNWSPAVESARWANSQAEQERLASELANLQNGEYDATKYALCVDDRHKIHATVAEFILSTQSIFGKTHKGFVAPGNVPVPGTVDEATFERQYGV